MQVSTVVTARTALLAVTSGARDAIGAGSDAFQVCSRRALQPRRAFAAIIVTAKATDRLNMRLKFLAVVVTAEASDLRDTWQGLGAIIIATSGLNACGSAPGQGENLAPVDRLCPGGNRQGEHGCEHDSFSFHDG